MKFSSLFQENDSLLSNFAVPNDEMAKAIEKAQAAKGQKIAEHAADLFSAIDSRNDALLTELRNVRKMEKLARTRLREFKEAVEYFLATNNFGPLYKFMPNEVSSACIKLGVQLPTAEDTKMPSCTKKGA